LLSPLKSLYCALSRSILEYAVVICDPNTVIVKNQVEGVQWKFLYFAARILHITHQPHDYEPVLTKLELTTLIGVFLLIKTFWESLWMDLSIVLIYYVKLISKSLTSIPDHIILSSSPSTPLIIHLTYFQNYAHCKREHPHFHFCITY
jgi:hypothetical protein